MLSLRTESTTVQTHFERNQDFIVNNVPMKCNLLSFIDLRDGRTVSFCGSDWRNHLALPCS